MDLKNITIKKAHTGLLAKEFSVVELTQEYLKNIKEKDTELNAFITVSEEDALKQAKAADKLFENKTSTILTGIPYSIKDAICVDGMRATGAGKILDNYIAPYSATVIKKLQEQGTVILGKTNCDTFGHGASNENSMYGAVKNPYDTTKVAGGSSGGSAASVAADMSMFSIGEDTGGSIRQPASFCGLAGLRVSYGRNSRHGIMPMASSLDTVGPMAKTVEDLAYILEVMAGHDTKDATTLKLDVPKYSEEINNDIKGLKIGIPKEYFDVEGMDDEVKQMIETKIQEMKKLGCEIKEVSLPYTEYAISVYYILTPSEDSSNMGRLDGIRYGVRDKAKDLFDIYAQSRANGFTEEVKRRIMIGTYALSAGYYDAYYRKAQKVRTLIVQDFDRVFEDVDVLFTPTSPFPAFGIGEKKDDVLAMYLADVFTVSASIAGLPALSVNAGFSKTGLPIGMQIIGPRMREDLVLNVGHKFEQTLI
jgi:aspartyl-tRNA(Asn)/glutamyl-tRNA(Gln) amidotransferase subunit A